MRMVLVNDFSQTTLIVFKVNLVCNVYKKSEWLQLKGGVTAAS
jgi:hypothetical protein